MICRVRVPATSANLGSGVDCLGVALSLYLDVSFETHEDTSRQTFLFRDETGNPFRIPDGDNLILAGLKSAERFSGRTLPGMNVSVSAGIPLSRGLGSSAAAVIAGLLGGFSVLGIRPEAKDVLFLANALEGHPDNVVPAYTGGFTAAMVLKDGQVVRQTVSAPQMSAVVAIPQFELSTKEARKALPETVPMASAVSQVQHACLMTAALQNGSLETLSEAAEDLLFTPPRKRFMPYLDSAFRTGRESGALCCMISGAGPSVLAFAPDPETAERIRIGWEEAFSRQGIPSRVLVTGVDGQGARVDISGGHSSMTHD